MIRVAAQLRRGCALRLHTGHEMQGTVDLAHMNGRVYDPTLGRFLSADPFIQAPAATLSYHRYAYVMNNPLVLTDPSGYSWLSKTWKKLWRNEAFRIGLTIAAGYFTGQFVGQWLVEAGVSVSRATLNKPSPSAIQ